jgi:hypothetical protein
MLKTILEAATERASFRPPQLPQEDFLKLGAQKLAAWGTFQPGGSETHIFKPLHAC